MKIMEIFKAPGLECTVHILPSGSPAGSTDACRTYELEISGRGEIVWANREGEGFSISSVYPVLKKQNCLKSGLSISYPATASMLAVMLIAENAQSEIISLQHDPEGRHSEIRIFADSPSLVRIRLTTLSDTLELLSHGAIPVSPPAIRLQFQLGLIGPDGKPGASGGKHAAFSLLPELADRFVECRELHWPESDKSSVFHIFGYGEGHDLGYPDYTPSPLLGGKTGLSKAADKLHSRGFMLSCYLNARIAEETALSRYPQLQPGIYRASDGSPLIETYQGRRFIIMQPSFEPWIDHLYNQAMMLRECGADAVQLDQVAGRAPVVPPGAPWGAGYRKLIQRLQSAGLKVWIQGVSDYYPADWFEMTYRDLSILPGGILRGGNPFGETDLRLLKALNPVGRYLVPLEKARILEKHYGSLQAAGLPLMIDVLGARGRLPVYSDDYRAELSQLVQSEDKI